MLRSILAAALFISTAAIAQDSDGPAPPSSPDLPMLCSLVGQQMNVPTMADPSIHTEDLS